MYRINLINQLLMEYKYYLGEQISEIRWEIWDIPWIILNGITSKY